jgi:predicted ATPase
VQASVVLSTEYEFPYLQAVGMVLQGWELARTGQGAAGIAQMHKGLAALRSTGAEVLRPYLLALLAEACVSDGQVEAGLGTLAEALQTAANHTERFYEAELHRLQGEFLLRTSVGATGLSSHQRQAAACFQEALDIARQQGAKSLELRAAMSLSRLWQQQGKRTEALQLLAAVFDWFTEGFDTVDLQEARALLDGLKG